MNVGLELLVQFNAAREKVRAEMLTQEIQEALIDFGERAMKMQRDQLRTDEAIERVAKAEFIREQADYEYSDREDWEDQHPSNQDVFRSRARTAITALLEEEDDE